MRSIRANLTALLAEEGLEEDELRRRAAELVDPARGTRAVLEAEAHVYRSLCEHLRQRTSVQNIDLMTLSGFCRNCLSKWLMRGAAMAGVDGVDDATARTAVYGMPYAAWKKQHQSASTAEQKAAYKASTHLHAVHEAIDLSDVCCQPTIDGAALPPTLRPSVSSGVCALATASRATAATSKSSAPSVVNIEAPSAPVGITSPYPMLPVDDAIELALAAAERAIADNIHAPEVLALSAVGADRRAALAVAAPIAMPPFRASIMDGYAVLAADGVMTRRCAGRALAGTDPTFTLARGECSYITTGSKLPAGADAVVRVEDVAVSGGADTRSIAPVRAVATGANVRPVGCDIARGATLVDAHGAISPAVLGLLAATGINTVAVLRRPVVGVLSTGDELMDVNSVTGPGLHGAQIFDANRAALLAALAAAGADTRDLGIVPDGALALGAALDAATAKCDVVVTSGGVSMGDADLVKVRFLCFFSVGVLTLRCALTPRFRLHPRSFTMLRRCIPRTVFRQCSRSAARFTSGAYS